jgi:hypothetical protein
LDVNQLRIETPRGDVCDVGSCRLRCLLASTLVARAALHRACHARRERFAGPAAAWGAEALKSRAVCLTLQQPDLLQHLAQPRRL